MWKYLSAKIRSLRKARGLTQRQLAALIGSAKGVVGHWEAGTRDVPKEALPVLTEVLGYDFVSIWMPPNLFVPTPNRRPRLPRYPVKGSVRDFPRLGYVCPRLSPLILSEMENAYPRDSEHELVAALKVLDDGGELCWTSLDQLGCPILVTTGGKHLENGLRHLRHALKWRDIVLVPQVTIAAVWQARTPRVDWLARCRNRWLYIELNGGQHDPNVDAVRAAGLNLRELRYSNQAVLKTRFIEYLYTDITKSAKP